MRTLRCRLPLPPADRVNSAEPFQTMDLEMYPDGGYEIRANGELFCETMAIHGRAMPKPNIVGTRISHTGEVRFYYGDGVDYLSPGFVAHFVSGKTPQIGVGNRRPRADGLST